MNEQPVTIDETSTNIGTLDYATPQTPDVGQDEQRHAEVSTLSDPLWPALVPVDLSGLGDVVSSAADAAGTAADMAGTAAGAVAEGVGSVVGGILEGLGGL